MSSIPHSLMSHLVNDTTTGYMSMGLPEEMFLSMCLISSRTRPDFVITGTESVGGLEWDWSVNLAKYVRGSSSQTTMMNPYPIMSPSTYATTDQGPTANPCILRLMKENKCVLQRGYITTDPDEMVDETSDMLIMQLPGVPRDEPWREYAMAVECTIFDEN